MSKWQARLLCLHNMALVRSSSHPFTVLHYDGHTSSAKLLNRVPGIKFQTSQREIDIKGDLNEVANDVFGIKSL